MHGALAPCRWDGGTESLFLPRFPGCMMEGGVFCSGVHNHGPTSSSEGDGAGGHGANMKELKDAPSPQGF